MHEPPANLKTAAIVQLVSGCVTMFIMFGLSSFTLSFVGGLITGICTLGLFPIGGLCGFLGCFLFPVGIFEVISGIMGLTNPQGAGKLMKIASFVEVAAILAGGLSTAIAGFVVMRMLSEPEVVAYIDVESTVVG